MQTLSCSDRANALHLGVLVRRFAYLLVGALVSTFALAAVPLDDWRRQAAEVRTLAENDAPQAYARAQQLQNELPADAPPADRARMLNLLSRIEIYLALTDAAGRDADQAAELARSSGDRVGEVEAALNVALNAVNQGRIDAVVDATSRSMTLLDGMNRPDLLGEALLRTAMTYRRVGQFDESVAMAMQAMEIARRNKNPLALAYAHQGLAISYDQSERLNEAFEHYERMREQAVVAQSKLLEAYAIAGLGAVSSKRADYPAAKKLYEQAITIFRSVGTPFNVNFALFGLAANLRNQGLYAQAQRQLDEVVEVYRQHPNRIGQWYALNARSANHESLGSTAAARADAERAYALAKDIGFPLYMSESARRMASIAATAGDHRRAYQLSQEAVEMTARAVRERSSARMLELTKRYDAESRQREIAELTRHNEQQTAELRQRELQQRWLWTVLAGSVAALAATALLLLRLRRSHRMLAQANEELQRSRSELQQQTSILQSILDSMGDGVSVADERGESVLINPAGEKILGIGVTAGSSDDWSEVYGLFLPDQTTLYPAADLPLVRAVQGESSDNVDIFLRNQVLPEGQWLSVTARPLIDKAGVGRGGVAVFSDITARRRAEEEIRNLNVSLEQRVHARTEELERSRNALQAIIENVPAVVFVKDLEGRYLRHNARLARVLGFHADESLVGRSDDELVDASNAARIAEEDRRVAVEGRIVSAEHELPGADGEPRIFQTHIFPLQDADGKCYAVGGISLDITDLKRAYQVAEAATRAKSEFLANMSHEIRTPMNAILGMSYLALQSGLNPQQHNYVQKVYRSAESLLGIINDILDFSKIEAGRLDMEHIAFDLGDVMDNLANVLGMKAEEKGLELLFKLPPDLPTQLLGDPTRLGQVLLNLGSNAVKFTAKGEVIVAVDVLERSSDSATLRFEVKDTGIGITGAQRRQLFQPFSQADTSTSRHFGGTGLGLVISRRLVGLMGGEIDLESDPGQGSCFRFSASFGLQEPGAVARPPATRDGLRGTRVLVVDDNASARELLAQMTSTLGLQPQLAVSGDEALRLVALADARDAPYGLMLLDWKMPGMDGIECARRMAQIPRRHPMPTVLMLTAFGRDEVLRRLSEQQLEVAATLTKPVTLSTLLDACAVAVGLSSSPVARSALRQDALQGHLVNLGGAHLLLVEDNPINQELAVDLLAHAGVVVQVAGNGLEALEMLAQHHFDGVLMDCQMPVMDGYEATRTLRRQAQWRDLPVIAMTANAMIGDRDKALAAGMNDHIAKPIKVEEMFATLARWVRPQAHTWVAEHPDGAIALAALPGIDSHGALARLSGDERLYRRLLGMFRDRESDFGGNFRSAYAAGDLAKATRLAHDLKSVSGTVGAQALSEAADALERACMHEANGAGIEALLDSVCGQLELVIGGLRTASVAREISSG